MRKGGGKAKGSSFERKVCEALSRFIDPDSDDTIFWRSAMSGGRATVQGKKGKANRTQLGDITCIDKRGAWITEKFVLECKFYGSLDIESSLIYGRGKLAKFWRDLYKLARKHDRQPFLIAKQNRTDALTILSDQGKHVWESFGNQVDSNVIVQTRELGPGIAYVCFFKDLIER